MTTESNDGAPEMHVLLQRLEHRLTQLETRLQNLESRQPVAAPIRKPATFEPDPIAAPVPHDNPAPEIPPPPPPVPQAALPPLVLPQQYRPSRGGDIRRSPRRAQAGPREIRIARKQNRPAMGRLGRRLFRSRRRALLPQTRLRSRLAESQPRDPHRPGHGRRRGAGGPRRMAALPKNGGGSPLPSLARASPF